MTETDCILVTGSSGCVGQYTCEWLLKNTDAKLLLLVRDPKKFSAKNTTDPRIDLLIGDIRNIHKFVKENNIKYSKIKCLL